MVRRSWQSLVLPLATAASAASVWAQTVEVRPPALAVTRLQGGQPSPATPLPDAAAPPRQEISPLLLTELDDRQASASLDGARRISLSVSRPMAIGDLLLLLVNGTPFSLVTEGDVSGTFTGDLKDLTMRQALEAVLFSRALDYDLQGTLLRVFPRRTPTRLFAVNYLDLRRTLQRTAGGAASVGPAHTVTELSSASSTDFYESIEKGVQALLSASGRMHLDRTAGLVQVTDFAERLDQVGVYLEAAQARASRQLRIDAQFLSVDLLSGSATSIDWTTAAIKSAAASPVSEGNGPMGLAVRNVDALIAALGEQGAVTRLASPHIVAMNNQPAIVRVGKEVVYFQHASTGTGPEEKRATTPLSVLDGLTLTVLAQVSADDFVQLHVSPAYATQTGAAKDGHGMAVPVLTTHEADTMMRVRDGETIVLAGFLSETGKPHHRNGLTRLFAGDSHTPVRSEFVVLLTPRVLKTAAASPE
jgi:MSHA biogenesis protein MshL